MGTTKRTQKRRPCYACETGFVVPTNIKGQALDYRDEVGLVIDRDLVVPRCDACGEMWLRASDTARLSPVLEELRLARKRAAVAGFVTATEQGYPNVPRAAWEDLLGLSRGYISRLVSGAKVPDTPLEILLAGIAQHPQQALEFLAATRPLPTALSAVVHPRSIAQRA